MDFEKKRQELAKQTDRFDFGPKMKALGTDRMRHFVQHMVITGGKSRILCLRDAGYQGNDNTLSAYAAKLMQDKRIQEAVVECTRGDMALFLPAAVRRLKEEVDNPQSTNGAKAAIAIMDRAGLHATQEVNYTHALSGDTERIQRLQVMAKAAGLDLSALLGSRLGNVKHKPPMVTDAEFEDVAETVDAVDLKSTNNAGSTPVVLTIDVSEFL